MRLNTALPDDPLICKPSLERRAPRGRPGSLRWIREMLSRPLGLEKRNKATHVVLLDRRRSAEQIRAEAMRQLCSEVHGRLRALRPGTERQAMRHLAAVHGALVRKGWTGLQAAPSSTLAKAAVQAQMLADQDPSPTILALVEHLRKLQVAAQVREDRVAHPEQYGHVSMVEVAETTAEAFAASEREWSCTMSPDITMAEESAGVKG